MIKISIKNIYLILIISIGLIVLGIGSSYAMFTASSNIDNPISLSSNLITNEDIFESFNVNLSSRESRSIKFNITNSNNISNIKYASWYIYNGDSNDISFSIDKTNDNYIDFNGELSVNGGIIAIDITNNTSNNISLTIGVSASKNNIILPDYMKLISGDSNDGIDNNYLIIKKGTGVSNIYYKISGTSDYVSSSNDVTVKVKKGAEYYYYGTAIDGYSINSCTESSPCFGTMGDENVTKTITATESTATYTFNLMAGSNVHAVYYKRSDDDSYSNGSSGSALMKLHNGTIIYYYGVPYNGYTMDSCTESSPCSVTINNKDVNITLSASASVTNYTLSLSMGTGVRAIYYKIGSSDSYTSRISDFTLSVESGTTVYYYGTASSSYTMDSCTSSSPCSVTVTSNISKTLYASIYYTLTIKRGTGVDIIGYKIANGSWKSTTSSSISLEISSGTTYYYYGVNQSGYTVDSCLADNPCTGTMTGNVTKTLTATLNMEPLIINKGTGVNKIYYKINNALIYSSSSNSSVTLSVGYFTTYYYYGVASSGYTMNSCTRSRPCSDKKYGGLETVTLSATAN